MIMERSLFFFGTIYLKPRTNIEITSVDNNRYEAAGSTNATLNSNQTSILSFEISSEDNINIDIFGYIIAGPTSTIFSVSTASDPIYDKLKIPDSRNLINNPTSTDGNSTSIEKQNINRNELLVFHAVIDSSSALGDIESSSNAARDKESNNVTSFKKFKQSLSPSPALKLIKSTVCFEIANPSSNKNLHFTIKSQSYRHPGMRLMLEQYNSATQDSNLSHCSDTFCALSIPSTGIIPPFSAVQIELKLISGDVKAAVKTSTTVSADIPDFGMRGRWLMPYHQSFKNSVDYVYDNSINPVNDRSSASVTSDKSSYTIACIPIEIWDDEFTLQPPRLVYAYLVSDTALPILLTKSANIEVVHINPPCASEKNSQKLLDNSNVQLLTAPEEIVPALPFMENVFLAPLLNPFQNKLLATIQLGSALEHLETTASPIDLGKQSYSREAIESFLILKNCSTLNSISYCVKSTELQQAEHLGDEDGQIDWLIVGQSGGIIKAGECNTLIVYLRRSTLGIHTGYITIQNMNKSSDYHKIMITYEIVNDRDLKDLN